MFKNFYFSIVLFLMSFFSVSVFCVPVAYTMVQKDFYITAEDILNARPKAPEVNLTPKNEKELVTMEKRHFNSENTYDSNKYRLAKMENYLLGRTWEFSPVEDRMNKLKLASQRKMLTGFAIPPGLRRAGFTPNRIANDSTPTVNEEDNVGIIDGLLKLYAPEAFKSYNERKKRMNDRYEAY